MKGHKHRPHWYFITVHYCPVCGFSEEFRERRYSSRPEKWEDRHEFKEMYDWCNERASLW